LMVWAGIHDGFGGGERLSGINRLRRANWIGVRCVHVRG